MACPVYKTIPALPGYKFGDDGSVWSLLFWSEQTGPDGWTRMKDAPAKGGYRKITIEGKTYAVHVLICTAFHGPKPGPDHEVLHKDGKPANNRAENLRWGTKVENRADQDLHGTASVGEKHYRASIPDSEIPNIERMIAEGMKQADVAEVYHTTQPTISRLLARKRKGLQ